VTSNSNPEDSKSPLTCSWCGSTFERTTNRGPSPSYCSASHRQRAYEARRAAHLNLVTSTERKQLRRSLEHFNRIGSDLTRALGDLPDTSALLSLDTSYLTDQLSAITQGLDYAKILGDMPDVSGLLELGSADLSSHLASVAEHLDLSAFLRDIPNRAGSLAAQLLPGAEPKVLNELVASVDLTTTLASIDWAPGLSAVVDQFGSLADLLEKLEEDDDASSGMSMHPAAPLVAAALMIALVVGPTLFAVLADLAVQLAATADVTLKLAAEIGSQSRHLEGAAYIYFVCQVSNHIFSAVRRGRDEPDTGA